VLVVMVHVPGLVQYTPDVLVFLPDEGQSHVASTHMAPNVLAPRNRACAVCRQTSVTH
jgi:hypothetical protein